MIDISNVANMAEEAEVSHLKFLLLMGICAANLYDLISKKNEHGF